MGELFQSIFENRGKILLAIIAGGLAMAVGLLTPPGAVERARATIEGWYTPVVEAKAPATIPETAPASPEPASIAKAPPAKSPEGAPQGVVEKPDVAIPKTRPMTTGAGYMPVHGEIITFHKVDAGDDVGSRIAAKIYSPKKDQFYYATLPLAVRTIKDAQTLFPALVGRYFDLIYMGQAANGTKLWKLIDADGVATAAFNGL